MITPLRFVYIYKTASLCCLSGINAEAGTFLSVSATVALSTRDRQHLTSSATAQMQLDQSAQQQIDSAACRLCALADGLRGTCQLLHLCYCLRCIFVCFSCELFVVRPVRIRRGEGLLR